MDKYFINQCKLDLLNRLEKMILPFYKLLNKDIKESAKDIKDEIQILASSIKQPHFSNINSLYFLAQVIPILFSFLLLIFQHQI